MEKAFFDVLVESEEEPYEKIMSISKNNDYTTDNLLDYRYFSKHCNKFKQTNSIRKPWFKAKN